MEGAPAILMTASSPPPTWLSKLLPGVIRFDIKQVLNVLTIVFDIKQVLNVLTIAKVWMEAFERVFAKMLAHGFSNLKDVQ